MFASSCLQCQTALYIHYLSLFDLSVLPTGWHHVDTLFIPNRRTTFAELHLITSCLCQFFSFQHEIVHQTARPLTLPRQPGSPWRWRPRAANAHPLVVPAGVVDFKLELGFKQHPVHPRNRLSASIAQSPVHPPAAWQEDLSPVEEEGPTAALLDGAYCCRFLGLSVHFESVCHGRVAR